jgi:hypothetical protein
MGYDNHLVEGWWEIVWAGIEPSRFSARITQERHVKPTGPDLIWGGGALAPV